MDNMLLSWFHFMLRFNSVLFLKEINYMYFSRKLNLQEKKK